MKYKNLWYDGISKYFLHLDGMLRWLPSGTACFANLFGVSSISPTDHQTFDFGSAPYPIGYPLPADIKIYRMPGDDVTDYLADVFPWQPDAIVLRHIVNPTQFYALGFTRRVIVKWPSEKAPFGVPLAIDSHLNWYSQTFFSGWHAVYAYLCHPETPMNEFFRAYLAHNLSKAAVKERIVKEQMLIDQLMGEVPIEPPTFSPAPGRQGSESVEVTISCATPSVTIYYTDNGEDPTTDSNSQSTKVYTGPITLDLSSSAQTVKALAEYHDSIGTSDVSTGEYNYEPVDVGAPTFNPPGGNFEETRVEVTIDCPTSGVTIFYTTDGTEPTRESRTGMPGSTVVPLDLSEGFVTLRAMAVHTQYGGSSEVESQTYGEARVEPTGLVLWLKADAIVGIENGETVETWDDSSTNALQAQGYGFPSAPILRTGAVNGVPAVHFHEGPGTSSHFQLPPVLSTNY